MKRLSVVIAGAGGLLAVALIGGTLFGSVLAAPGGGEARTSDGGPGFPPFGGEYCEVFLDTFAAELGVERDALAPAAAAAANAALDAAVAAGGVTEERAAEIRERIADGDPNLCQRLGGAGGPRHGGDHDRHHVMYELSEAAAGALGIEHSDLLERLRAGESLREIAQAEGVDYATVTEAVLAAARAELDEAVAAGTISRERADEILERITDRLEEGELGR